MYALCSHIQNYGFFLKALGKFCTYFDTTQGHHGWQGPQGPGLAWILKKRKRQHTADVAATMAALLANKWPWRPLRHT
jgi:hypothetical protein